MPHEEWPDNPIKKTYLYTGTGMSLWR
jgi:hypothetical protein